MLLPTEWSDT